MSKTCKICFQMQYRKRFLTSILKDSNDLPLPNGSCVIRFAKYIKESLSASYKNWSKKLVLRTSSFWNVKKIKSQEKHQPRQKPRHRQSRNQKQKSYRERIEISRPVHSTRYIKDRLTIYLLSYVNIVMPSTILHMVHVYLKGLRVLISSGNHTYLKFKLGTVKRKCINYRSSSRNWTYAFATD